MHHTNECGCEHGGYHTSWQAGHHQAGCCCMPHHGVHRFPTKEEILAGLEEYLKHLQEEVKGVEERIAEFKKAA